jgi:hypothetical protein
LCGACAASYYPRSSRACCHAGCQPDPAAPLPPPLAAAPRPRPRQEELAYLLPHPAGLNPKAFRNRYARTPRALAGGFSHTRPIPPAANTLLMGDLLWRYLGLDLRQQAQVAAALGVTRHDVLADLRAFSVATAFL